MWKGSAGGKEWTKDTAERERTIDSVLPLRWVGRWQAQGEEERPEVSAEAQ